MKIALPYLTDERERCLRIMAMLNEMFRGGDAHICGVRVQRHHVKREWRIYRGRKHWTSFKPDLNAALTIIGNPSFDAKALEVKR